MRNGIRFEETCRCMWIVRLALRRPYTFTVMAILIGLLGIVTIVRMATDIFPSIDIPVPSIRTGITARLLVPEYWRGISRAMWYALRERSIPHHAPC